MATTQAKSKPGKHELERLPDRPPIAPIDPGAIPRQLREAPQWVLWKWQWSDDRACWTKVPKRPVNDGCGFAILPAKSDTPATWGALDDPEHGGVGGAYGLYDAHHPGLFGLGFVLAESDPFAVIDLDDCRDRDSGEITPGARAVVERFGTYAEVSPSGTGLKLFLRARKPGDRCRTGEHPGVEVYDRARFVAVTGARLEGCPGEPQDRQAELEAYYGELFGAPEEAAPRPAGVARPAPPPPCPHNAGVGGFTLSDAEVLRRASAAANGARFDRLWAGDTSDHAGDRSAADFALASVLAFWVGPDVARIVSLMRRSGLARPKWERPDYLPRTVARALAGRSEFYGDRLTATLLRGEAAACPRIPLIPDQEDKTGECGDNAPRRPDLLAGLPDPPPACACRRGGAFLLEHTEDPDRHRACRHACDGWGCPVCRERNAHQWVTHLAACADGASQEGCTLYLLEATRERLDGQLRRRLHRGGAEWAALELLPGVYLLLMALPAGVEPPPGAAAVTLGDAAARLVRWAAEVRAGPEPYARRRKKMRPVRTSAGWRLNRPEPSGQWKQVAVIDTQDIDDVYAIVREEGARVTCEISDPGERREGGGSQVWRLEWRVGPDGAGRITRRLRGLDARPAGPPPRPLPDDYCPFDDEPPSYHDGGARGSAHRPAVAVGP